MSPDNKTKEEYVKSYFKSAIKRKSAEVKREKLRGYAQSFNRIGGGAIKAFARGRAPQLRTAKMIRKPIPLSSGGKYYYQGDQLVRGRVKFGRGRPKGSYEPSYAKWGGVYGFRKAMSMQYSQQRAQAMQQANISPEQQQIINQFEAQRRARMGTPFGWESVDVAKNMEREVSSNSAGSLQDEINNAANAVP